MPIRDLEPRYLWKQFDRIRSIPRPSKHEEKIRAYVESWAKEKGFQALTDKAGNVVVKVPASKGHEKAPVLVLQAHMDMVCEKNKGTEFDFMKDAIQLQRDGDWLKAKGTTLGSDNGIGMAAAMAIAEDPSVTHGPLEVLITVDEETGLTGAAKLDPAHVVGKRLLNLDTEELGALYIGCAGGGDSNISIPVRETPTMASSVAIHIRVSGLRGGHSGMDIVEQRGNAIKTLARILWEASAQGRLNLIRIEGGGVHNAIPREASADIVVEKAKVDDVARIAAQQADAVRVELGSIDPGLKVEVSTIDVPKKMWDDATTRRIVGLILVIPYGVDAMSKEVAGLVETSNNLASVWTREGKVVIGTSSRSSVASSLKAMRDRIRAAGQLAGGAVEENNGYPGWKPDLGSEVLKITKDTYKKVFGDEPVLKAVHAGLECGIIGEKLPGMDMVSFGPWIEAPHSPDERVNIPSVAEFWKFLTAVVGAMS